jgi:hypothetical protein
MLKDGMALSVGLDDAEFGVKHHEALSQQNEQQLELDSEKLRDLKYQSDQVGHAHSAQLPTTQYSIVFKAEFHAASLLA